MASNSYLRRCLGPKGGGYGFYLLFGRTVLPMGVTSCATVLCAKRYCMMETSCAEEGARDTGVQIVQK